MFVGTAVDAATIVTRQETVEELSENENMFSDVERVLQQMDSICDIERLISACIQDPKNCRPETADERIKNMLRLKSILCLVEPFRRSVEEGRTPLLRAHYQILQDVRFDAMLGLIDKVLHPDSRIEKSALQMEQQKVLAVRPGINGKSFVEGGRQMLRM